MGTLAKIVTKVVYILMLLTCFATAIAVVTCIGGAATWSQPFAIVGNIMGYSTIAALSMSTLHRLIMLCCPIPSISCRVECALAGIASILWFITASVALTVSSSEVCTERFRESYHSWHDPSCYPAEVVATMGFVNGTLLCIFFAVLCILISRQLKHGNKNVWANPLTTAIITVSGPPDLEVPYRPDSRMDGHDPQSLIQAIPMVTTSPCTLLNPNRNMGQDMPIDEFCQYFGLPSSVLEKLKENAYNHARYLRYITMDNLTEMGFKLGEKAALQDAVERWSVSR